MLMVISGNHNWSHEITTMDLSIDLIYHYTELGTKNSSVNHNIQSIKKIIECCTSFKIHTCNWKVFFFLTIVTLQLLSDTQAFRFHNQLVVICFLWLSWIWESEVFKMVDIHITIDLLVLLKIFFPFSGNSNFMISDIILHVCLWLST